MYCISTYTQETPARVQDELAGPCLIVLHIYDVFLIIEKADLSPDIHLEPKNGLFRGHAN